MTIAELFADRSLKPKEKVEMLTRLIVEKSIKVPELISFAEDQKAALKASCIEALEHLTRTQPKALPQTGIDLCLRSLGDKEPRVKWESARVIGNCIQGFPKQVDEAAKALLANADHEGTVVRCSAAFALGQIILMRTPLNGKLIGLAEAISKKEEKNSIRKIYEAAIKKASK